MLAVHLSGEEEAYLDAACAYLKQFVCHVTKEKGVWVLGPAPEPIAKLQDQYRRVLYLKAEEEKKLVEIKNQMERYIEMNPGYQRLLIQFEIC